MAIFNQINEDIDKTNILIKNKNYLISIIFIINYDTITGRSINTTKGRYTK